MITFDINGAIVEFDDTMDNYNSIRKQFQTYAFNISNQFEEDCLNNAHTIKQISEQALEIGEGLIDSIIKKGVETIVTYRVITIDFNIFKEQYCKKYLDYARLFNNLMKEHTNSNNRGRKNNNVTKFYEIKPIIKKLAEYIYNDCFNIHYAIIDVLLDHNVSNVHCYIDNKSIRQANALFNNYKDGFIGKADECKVVKQIISLNPYRQDIYEFFIKEDGDFSEEIERLTDYLGYDIKEYKATLMDIYIKQLIESNCVIDIESSKEKVKKYAKYIGCKDDSIYITRIDAIYTFENA